MFFIFFTGLLWLIALFHVWDHRRFERDLARLAETVHLNTGGPPARNDWRPVPLPVDVSGGVAFRRALMVNSRFDALRYAVPVVFFVILLIGLKSWIWAGLYLAVVAVKWFGTTTVLYRTEKRYEIYLGRRAVFGAPLP